MHYKSTDVSTGVSILHMNRYRERGAHTYICVHRVIVETQRYKHISKDTPVFWTDVFMRMSCGGLCIPIAADDHAFAAMHQDYHHQKKG